MPGGLPRQWEDDQRRWDDNSGSAMTMREMVRQHDTDIEGLKAWRSELRGALGLVRITLGTSLVTGILAAVALIDLLTRAHQ